jgi:hypothetical protein
VLASSNAAISICHLPSDKPLIPNLRLYGTSLNLWTGIGVLEDKAPPVVPPKPGAGGVDGVLGENPLKNGNAPWILPPSGYTDTTS